MRGKALFVLPFVLLASAILIVGACAAQVVSGEGQASIAGDVEETNHVVDAVLMPTQVVET